MNTTDKYLACPEHHSGITRVRLNPEYAPPRRSVPEWWLVSHWYLAIGGGILLGAFLARWVLT